MEERKVSVSPLGVPQIASHHERLIAEVESSDGQLGAILRYLQRGVAIERHVGVYSSGHCMKMTARRRSMRALLYGSRATRKILKRCATRTTRGL